MFYLLPFCETFGRVAPGILLKSDIWLGCVKLSKLGNTILSKFPESLTENETTSVLEGLLQMHILNFCDENFKPLSFCSLDPALQQCRRMS